MATSIITYNNKYIDVNDNILIFSLYFIKIIAFSKDIPNWFKGYVEKVIDVVIDLKPIGWGYMDLEEYLVEDSKKEFFLGVLDSTINYLKYHRKSDIVDNIEANYILKNKGVERWDKKNYIDNKYVIQFLEDLKILLENNKH